MEDLLLRGQPVLLHGIEIMGMEAEGMDEVVIIIFTLTTAELTKTNGKEVIVKGLAAATDNVPALVTENLPAPATANVPAPETDNVPAPATANVPVPVVCRIFRQENRLVIDSHQNAIMYMQTRTGMLAGKIWMDGRRKIKLAGVIQSNLLKLAETWIINIKQDSAGQATQEVISHEQDRHIHVHRRAGLRQGQDQVEGVVEVEVVAAEAEEVEVEGVRSQPDFVSRKGAI